MSSEFIQLEPDTTSIRLLASSSTTENSKSVVASYLVNSVLTPGELSIISSDVNCVVIDKKTLEDGKFQLTMTVGANAQKCATTLTLTAGNVEKTMDVRVYGSNEDENGNHLLDYYETALKQGETCKKYSDCDSDDGKEKGFCDSFIGYQCSTKCSDDIQCVPDETIDGNTFHYICRKDGRCAPDTFETVWKTVNAGESITILLKNAQKCEFHIDWGDNSKEEINNCDEDLVHAYPTIGKHHVKIKGTLLGWHTVAGINYLADSDDEIGVDEDDNDNAPKLLEVVSFGTVGFDGSINRGFANATNLAKLSAVDIPDASELKSMKEMFTNARDMNYPIGNWDTSNVVDMVNAFSFAASFNQDIGHWDTSKVTNMSGMFYNAVAFNQDIGEWDTSNVFSISDMFHGASAFNQKIGSWDTSSIARMIYVFYRASSFNQNIGNWNTSQVQDMGGMFKEAVAFNQDISKWDTSNVESMAHMFKNASTFNQDISGWKTSKVLLMEKMFYNASAFNQNISAWDVTNVVNHNNIFCHSGLSEDLKNDIKQKWSEQNSNMSNLLSCSE